MLRNLIAGLLFIFNLWRAASKQQQQQQQQQQRSLEHRWCRLIPKPRQKQHNNQAWLLQTNNANSDGNNKRKNEHGHCGQESKNWLQTQATPHQVHLALLLSPSLGACQQLACSWHALGQAIHGTECCQRCCHSVIPLTAVLARFAQEVHIAGGPIDASQRGSCRGSLRTNCLFLLAAPLPCWSTLDCHICDTNPCRRCAQPMCMAACAQRRK
jgi:hypothetical protein